MMPIVSMAWPSKQQRVLAARSFDEAVEAFEAAVESAYAMHEADRTGDEQDWDRDAVEAACAPGPAIDVSRLWRDVVQNGAPQEIRANGWLTLAWARRCIRREEPRLYWVSVAAGLFVGSAWVFDLVRAIAERVIS